MNLTLRTSAIAALTTASVAIASPVINLNDYFAVSESEARRYALATHPVRQPRW